MLRSHDTHMNRDINSDLPNNFDLGRFTLGGATYEHQNA